MKFSWKWLKEYLPISWSVDELAERLTMAGVEVEGIQIQGRGFERIVVAQILKSERHPNADRLSVCEVNTGSEVKQIVCGAKNYKVGDKVPLALPGARLPNGMEIKSSQLRGVQSDGMMCSPKELGLAEDAQGLLILDATCPLGQLITDTLGLNDIILDLEITPNRPDLLSHWGMAREIAALANIPISDFNHLLSEEEKKLSNSSLPVPTIPIRVEDPENCSCYTARIIRGVKIGPSPDWLKRRLESLGHRSISNIVDITNYILCETGQPLHAFDLNLLKGPKIVVRRARVGEKLIRLDDEISELNQQVLIIADAERPVAVAGVMGGKETGVSLSTSDILLESANFQPSTIRKISKTLGVSTESSYRFERGVDQELAARASLRATAMILQLCGGHVDGSIKEVSTTKPSTRKIVCRYSRVQSLLGIPISPEEINSALKRLGCELDKFNLESCEVKPPSCRLDLEREIDLIEEVVRVYGIEKVPAILSPTPPSTTRNSASFLFTQKLRALAIAMGLDEATNNTIISSDFILKTLRQSPDLYQLRNPLSTEMDALRPSLFSGLFQACAHNLAASSGGVGLFEIGKIFNHQNGRNIDEKLSLGVILAGKKKEGASWEKGRHGITYDWYDLKGVVDGLLEGFDGVPYQQGNLDKNDAPMLETGSGLLFLHNNKKVGFAGKVCRGHDRGESKVPVDIYYAEFDVEWLSSSLTRMPQYRSWPIYPAVRRDIAMTLAISQKHQGIEESLRRLVKKYAEPKGIFLRQVEIFDIFQSDQVGVGKKSIAYSMTYQSASRTLTDHEVNEIHQSIKETLKKEIGAEIRE